MTQGALRPLYHHRLLFQCAGSLLVRFVDGTEVRIRVRRVEGPTLDVVNANTITALIGQVPLDCDIWKCRDLRNVLRVDADDVRIVVRQRRRATKPLSAWWEQQTAPS